MHVNNGHEALVELELNVMPPIEPGSLTREEVETRHLNLLKSLDSRLLEVRFNALLEGRPDGPVRRELNHLRARRPVVVQDFEQWLAQFPVPSLDGPATAAVPETRELEPLPEITASLES